MAKLKVFKKLGLWLLVIILCVAVSGIIGSSLNSLATFNANQLTLIILSGLTGYVLELKKNQQFGLLIFSFFLSFMLLPTQAGLVVIFLPAVLKKLKLI